MSYQDDWFDIAQDHSAAYGKQSMSTELVIQPVPTREKPRKGKIGAKLVALSLCSALIGGVATGALMPKPQGIDEARVAALVEEKIKAMPSSASQLATAQTGSTQVRTVASTSDRQVLSISEIHEKVGPAVVSISTKMMTRSRYGGLREQASSGSGVILSEDGVIATNNHVIEGATSIMVHLQDGSEYEAQIIGADAQYDLALLRVNATGLPFAELGDSDQVKVGELAVAIGDPLGELSGSVTSGVISAVNRSMDIDGQVMHYLQTDAAINPGNSGGALINQFGELIGINTAKTSAVGVEGLGFAIPINEAKPIFEAFLTNGKVPGRPELGVTVEKVSAAKAAPYGLPAGVYIASVKSGSAAEAAGLQLADRIVSINGKEIQETSDVSQAIQGLAAMERVRIELEREGQTITVEAVLQEAKTA